MKLGLQDMVKKRCVESWCVVSLWDAAPAGCAAFGHYSAARAQQLHRIFLQQQVERPKSNLTGLLCVSVWMAGEHAYRYPARKQWYEREHRVRCAAVSPARFVTC